jgi:ribosome biogenesis GTPase A
MNKINQENIYKIKQNITAAWQNLQTVSSKEKQDELIEGFYTNIKQMQAGTYRLVVMGEIKKGKSSFINALLGEKKLLPTASDVDFNCLSDYLWT